MGMRFGTGIRTTCPENQAEDRATRAAAEREELARIEADEIANDTILVPKRRSDMRRNAF